MQETVPLDDKVLLKASVSLPWCLILVEVKMFSTICHCYLAQQQVLLSELVKEEPFLGFYGEANRRHS